MLGFDAQQRAQETLRKIDQMLENDLAVEEAVRSQGQAFRDALFSAFQFIEREALQLKALLVQLRRLDANQLQVQSRGRLPFVVVLDPEVAYDIKSKATGQLQPIEGSAQRSVELAARLFVVLAPPYHGVIRHYTIFADGMWKRTTYTFEARDNQARSALLQRFNLDVLVQEAADLLGYVCTLHPIWKNLAPSANTLTFDMVRERTHVKDQFVDRGIVRRAQP